MSTTQYLGLPNILPSQAQKHVTHNEALAMLDALVHLAVERADLQTPPSDPADGQRFIVGADATGAWSGRSGDVAAFIHGAWQLFAPSDGWLAWDRTTEAMLIRKNGSWEPHLPENPGTTVQPDPFPNLLSDSGRFNGASQQNQLIAGVAAAPTYIEPYNGAQISFPFRFIHDNSDFGGSAGALAGTVRDLVEKVYGSAGLLHGPEFWCMRVESAGGTAAPVSIGGQQLYLSTRCTANPRPVRFTTGLFVRSETGAAGLRQPGSAIQTFSRDGNPVQFGSNDAVVVPEDGWVYFEMQAERPPISYELYDLALNLSADGAALCALPRVIAGWMDIGFDARGVIPNDRVFG